MTTPEQTDATRENQAILDGYWVRAMEALVQQGVPYDQAAKSMLTIAALQAEAALGSLTAEASLTLIGNFIARRREADETGDASGLPKRH